MPVRDLIFPNGGARLNANPFLSLNEGNGRSCFFSIVPSDGKSRGRGYLGRTFIRFHLFFSFTREDALALAKLGFSWALACLGKATAIRVGRKFLASLFATTFATPLRATIPLASAFGRLAAGRRTLFEVFFRHALVHKSACIA